MGLSFTLTPCSQSRSTTSRCPRWMAATSVPVCDTRRCSAIAFSDSTDCAKTLGTRPSFEAICASDFVGNAGLFGITGVPGAAEPADVAAVAAAAAAADGVESAACASRGGVAASPGEETCLADSQFSPPRLGSWLCKIDDCVAS